jgi:SAM-dependent methyltransferase
VPGSQLSQFYALAPYYDVLNGGKDYRGEVRRLEEIARRFVPAGASTWLDVACGTGRHLEFLGRRRRVEGVDESPAMLRIARRRLPGVPLLRGDMRTFRLSRRFDVLTCLYGAIGHLGTRNDLRKAFVNFAQHVRPGGVVIVEPWILSEHFRPGMIDVRTREGPDVTTVRMTRSERRGRRSVLEVHFLIAERGRGVRHFREIDVGLLLSREELLRLMREAGLRPHFVRRGLIPYRGLVVGVRPRTGPVPRRGGAGGRRLRRFSSASP